MTDARHQHGELVATEPGESVVGQTRVLRLGSQRLPVALVFADDPLQPFRRFDDQLVAGGVAEAVVDVLESIEVEEEHREPEPGHAAPVVDQPLHAVGEHSRGSAGR